MSGVELTHASLLEMLHYDPASGVFTWLKRVAICLSIGDVAGRKTSGQYLQIKINYRAYLSHRLAWFYTHGSWPVGEIDHINGNRFDNRIANLRDVSVSLNQLNRFKQVPNRLGFTGLYAKRGRFGARIKVNGRQKYLGVFDTPEQASAAYEKARSSIHQQGGA
jgi:hypothetical protein